MLVAFILDQVAHCHIGTVSIILWLYGFYGFYDPRVLSRVPYHLYWQRPLPRYLCCQLALSQDIWWSVAHREECMRPCLYTGWSVILPSSHQALLIRTINGLRSIGIRSHQTLLIRAISGLMAIGIKFCTYVHIWSIYFAMVRNIAKLPLVRQLVCNPSYAHWRHKEG